MNVPCGIEEENGIERCVCRAITGFFRCRSGSRGRTITMAICFGESRGMNVAGYDDAADARWFALSDMPSLAFDHEHVLQVALQRLALKFIYN